MFLTPQSLLAEGPIMIDEPTSSNLCSDFDQFVSIPSLERDIKRVPEGYEVHAKITSNVITTSVVLQHSSVECVQLATNLV
ncbi:hypothetical protein AJ78_07144 [Emergomyces pasteurianus Ep9510]|uniref:Uncharacterized protein n=1 Tax=Emergomyces pasteurianus Ep9510 TaxID=1447872 RepID=A0A1J9PWF4_9EURO|nr:hypothetical protein AJ78_07144 [Emergomyces pasteurianus Ep9510]